MTCSFAEGDRGRPALADRSNNDFAKSQQLGKWVHRRYYMLMSTPSMPKLRIHCFAISIDGYGAGPKQDMANPLGVGGTALHEWAFPTRTFRQMFGGDGGTTGIDDDFAARGFYNIGAWILGRNMFGPVRGPWP